MRKRLNVLTVLVLIVAVMMVACNKSESIICGNCSTANSKDNPFCSNCGTTFFQDDTQKPSDGTQSTTPSENTEPSAESVPQNTEPAPTQPTPTQPAHTHSYSAATCTKPGTCSCGATNGDALGHSYKSKTTSPTCTSQGYTTYTCSACGDSYKDNYVNAKHNYQNYKCISCGAIDKEHAYEYLTNWVLENGEPTGAYTHVRYFSGDVCFSFTYSANYDYICASLSFYSAGQFFYTDIGFDNYNFYTSFDDNEVSGCLNASTFTSNSPIPYSYYTGDDNEKYDMIDLSRTSVCDILDWAKWYLVEYNVGITLADLGFTAY